MIQRKHKINFQRLDARCQSLENHVLNDHDFSNTDIDDVEESRESREESGLDGGNVEEVSKSREGSGLDQGADHQDGNNDHQPSSDVREKQIHTRNRRRKKELTIDVTNILPLKRARTSIKKRY